MTFFTKEQQQFFRPLTWGCREQIAACVKAIFERLYGPEAAFNRLFDRKALLEEVTRALAVSAEFAALPGDSNDAEDVTSGAKDPAWVVRQLEAYGWLEIYTDSISVERVWRLTPKAKRIARVLWELDRRVQNTRQRNMRSCANSLKAYTEKGDADDLLDAKAYAEQVLDDLSNDIETFRLLIREATRDALAGRHSAIDEFVTFVTERFRKEFGTRLVADSAERLKSTIIDRLDELRALDTSKLKQFESQLRDRVMSEDGARQGLLVLRTIDRIETLVRGACETKLPELHGTIKNYISRRMVLIRQSLSVRTSENSDPALKLSQALAVMGATDRDAILALIAEKASAARIRLYEPRSFRFEIAVPEVQVEDTSLDIVADPESVLQAEILRRQEEHLAISEEATIEYLLFIAGARNGRVRLSELDPESARELLFSLAGGPIVAALENSALSVRDLQSMADTEFFTTNDIEFQLTGTGSPS